MNEIKVNLEKGIITLNGAKLDCIKSYSLNSLEVPKKVEVTITFDAEVIGENENVLKRQ